MKSFIFIDGNNLYYRLKSVAEFYSRKNNQEYGTIDFNFKEFCNFLAKETDICGIRYYVGQVKRSFNKNNKDFEKAEKMYASQQRLAAHLKNQGIEIKYGKLLKEPSQSGIYHEKGVDVQIAVDMIKLARENFYDIAYLLSSDSDLIPAVEEVKFLKKTVIYVGVKRIPTLEQLKILQEQKKDPYCISYGLTKLSSDFKIIEKEQVLLFLGAKNKMLL